MRAADLDWAAVAPGAGAEYGLLSNAAAWLGFALCSFVHSYACFQPPEPWTRETSSVYCEYKTLFDFV